MSETKSFMTPRQALEADKLALERILDTMSAIYVKELESQNPSESLNEYLKGRVNYLYDEWFKIHSLLSSMPPIIDVRFK